MKIRSCTSRWRPFRRPLKFAFFYGLVVCWQALNVVWSLQQSIVCWLSCLPHSRRRLRWASKFSSSIHFHTLTNLTSHICKLQMYSVLVKHGLRLIYTWKLPVLHLREMVRVSSQPEPIFRSWSVRARTPSTHSPQFPFTYLHATLVTACELLNLRAMHHVPFLHGRVIYLSASHCVESWRALPDFNLRARLWSPLCKKISWWSALAAILPEDESHSSQASFS